MRIDLNSDKLIFWPPHKLGEVEWDFVEAQLSPVQQPKPNKRSTHSMYASATMVVCKKDEEGNHTDFRECEGYRPLNQETTLDRYPSRTF